MTIEANDLRPMVGRTIGSYLETLGSIGPAPGGGSVTGLIGALAAALGQMVANVSGKGQDDPTFADQVVRLQVRLDAFVNGAEADEAAYGSYIAATRLPRNTAEEKIQRRIAVQDALRISAVSPLSIATNAASLLDDLLPVIEFGARHILSDVEIGLLLAEASVVGALVNVRANIPFIKDETFVGELTQAVADTESRARISAEIARQALLARRT